MNVNQKKAVLKQAIKDTSLVMKISDVDDLHPTTLTEIHNYVHQIQNILVAEYARYTPLKDELQLV